MSGRLFPRCAAVVQPCWGARVAAIGAGLAAIAHRKLSAERLAEAIETAVDDSDLRRRPAGIGEARRAEDGVADAVDLIEAAARSPGANAA